MSADDYDPFLEPRDLHSFLSVRLTNLSRKFANNGRRLYERLYQVNARELRILLILRTYGRQTSTDLAEIAHMDKGTISRGVRELRRRGLVKAEVSEDDLRSSILMLTAEGRDLAEACFRTAQKRQRSVIEALTEAERAQLSALLVKVEARLDEI